MKRLQFAVKKNGKWFKQKFQECEKLKYDTLNCYTVFMELNKESGKKLEYYSFRIFDIRINSLKYIVIVKYFRY